VKIRGKYYHRSLDGGSLHVADNVGTDDGLGDRVPQAVRDDRDHRIAGPGKIDNLETYTTEIRPILAVRNTSINIWNYLPLRPML
jgi:hypothetical protein